MKIEIIIIIFIIIYFIIITKNEGFQINTPTTRYINATSQTNVETYCNNQNNINHLINSGIIMEATKKGCIEYILNNSKVTNPSASSSKNKCYYNAEFPIPSNNACSNVSGYTLTQTIGVNLTGDSCPNTPNIRQVNCPCITSDWINVNGCPNGTREERGPMQYDQSRYVISGLNNCTSTYKFVDCPCQYDDIWIDVPRTDNGSTKIQKVSVTAGPLTSCDANGPRRTLYKVNGIYQPMIAPFNSYQNGQFEEITSNGKLRSKDGFCGVVNNRRCPKGQFCNSKGFCGETEYSKNVNLFLDHSFDECLDGQTEYIDINDDMFYFKNCM